MIPVRHNRGTVLLLRRFPSDSHAIGRTLAADWLQRGPR